jgi:hypothetical protein
MQQPCCAAPALAPLTQLSARCSARTSASVCPGWYRAPANHGCGRTDTTAGPGGGGGGPGPGTGGANAPRAAAAPGRFHSVIP